MPLRQFQFAANLCLQKTHKVSYFARFYVIIILITLGVLINLVLLVLGLCLLYVLPVIIFVSLFCCFFIDLLNCSLCTLINNNRITIFIIIIIIIIIIIFKLILRKCYFSTSHIWHYYGTILSTKHACQDLRYFYCNWVYYFSLFIFVF